MKKIILLLAAIVVTGSGVFAQLSWGIKGGLNISSIDNMRNSLSSPDSPELDIDIDPDNKLGGNMKPSFYAGAFAEYKITKGLGVQLEVVYSRQGARYSYDIDPVGSFEGYDAKGVIAVRANYINVPVIAKIHATKELSLDIGPQFGFMAGKPKMVASVEASKDDIRTTSKTVLKMNNNMLESFDMSLSVGASYKFTDNLDMTVRYNFGLTDIAGSDMKKINSLRNNNFQLGLGFRY